MTAGLPAQCTLFELSEREQGVTRPGYGRAVMQGKPLETGYRTDPERAA